MTSNSTYGSFYKNEKPSAAPVIVPPLVQPSKNLTDEEMLMKIQRQEYLSSDALEWFVLFLLLIIV